MGVQWEQEGPVHTALRGSSVELKSKRSYDCQFELRSVCEQVKYPVAECCETGFWWRWSYSQGVCRLSGRQWTLSMALWALNAYWWGSRLSGMLSLMWSRTSFSKHLIRGGAVIQPRHCRLTGMMVSVLKQDENQYSATRLLFRFVGFLISCPVKTMCLQMWWSWMFVINWGMIKKILPALPENASTQSWFVCFMFFTCPFADSHTADIWWSCRLWCIALDTHRCKNTLLCSDAIVYPDSLLIN